MTTGFSFVYADQLTISGLMNDSKWKHDNKISNAPSNKLYQTPKFTGLAMDSVQISAMGIMSKIYAN